LNSKLRHELKSFGLVAAGAIPGALLRWQCERLGYAAIGGLRGLVAADFVANMLGCLVIGIVVAQPPSRFKLTLWLGIGFCGSLTTFSAWILQLHLAIHSGSVFKALVVLLASLAGGLALVCLGYAMGRLGQGRRIR
jgi:CrcB protein